MTVDLSIREAPPMGVHPFRGMSCGKEHGQRLRVRSRLQKSDPEVPGTDVYVGEAILLRWSDDSVNGMMTRVLLDGGPDGANGIHPFEGYPTGRKEGESLRTAFWAVGDDERIVHPERVRRRTPFHELSEVAQSQILCRDSRFVSYLVAREIELAGAAVSPRPEGDPHEFAAVVVRTHLDIPSRRVLGQDTADGRRARQAWDKLLAAYFGNPAAHP